MSEITACLLAFIIFTLALVIIFYIGSISRTDSRLSDIRELVAEIKNTPDFGDRLLIFFAYSPLLLRTGFYGLMLIFGASGYSGVAVVCGQNPWPYIKDIIYGIFDFIRGDEVA